MTAMTQLHAIGEFWKFDTEFTHIEVSNTGRFRNGVTKAPIPIYGSGGKASVKLVDSHGRRYERNVRRLVRKLFGTAPIRLAQTVTTPIEEDITVSTAENTAEDWVNLSWPGVVAGYRISREGAVTSPQGKVLKGAIQHSPLGNYMLMNLLRTGDWRDGYVKARLDELVATHFVGPRPGENYCTRHIDGDKMNCHADNLEWAGVTHQRFKRSPFTAPRPAAGIRTKRAKALNADPNWRAVTHPKIQAGQFWVSRDGKARGLQNIDLSEYPREDGRISVYMRMADGGSRTTVALDELVLEAFAGERPTPKHRPVHRNGDKTDNRIDNLYWGVPGKPEPKQADPVPTPTPVITPTRAEVTVTTLAAYRVGDVEVIVNNGIIEPPKGGTAVQQAAALAKIYAEIARGEGQ